MEEFEEDRVPSSSSSSEEFLGVVSESDKLDLVLFVHPPFDGLPSWRPSSLSVLALLSFHSVRPRSVVFSSNDAMSRSGELPVLRTPRVSLCNHRDLSRGLQRFVLPEGTRHCDEKMDEKQKHDMTAYDELCHGALNRLLMRTWWLMHRNRELVIEPRVLGHMPWIVRGRTGHAFVRYLANNLHARRPLMMEARDVRRRERPGRKFLFLFFNCFKIFACLDSKLGDQLYLFGDSPTSIDAAAFGYLCAMLYTQLPDPILSVLLQESFPRLVHYVQRILSDYLGVNVKSLTLPRERNDVRVHESFISRATYIPGLANGLFRVVLAVGFGYIFYQAWTSAKEMK